MLELNSYQSEAWLATQDDEDVLFNRRMGIDENREGDDWNRPFKRRAAVGYCQYHDKVIALRDGCPLCKPEKPVQPREVPLWPRIPVELREGALLAYRHAIRLNLFRDSHDSTDYGCGCGQPDDGEAPMAVETHDGWPVPFNDLKVKVE